MYGFRAVFSTIPRFIWPTAFGKVSRIFGDIILGPRRLIKMSFSPTVPLLDKVPQWVPAVESQ